MMLLCAALISGAAFADPPPPAPAATVDQAPAPPPDPNQGERSDGRENVSKARDRLLLAPRLLLLPPRFLFYILSWPTRWIVEFEERHHIYQRLYDASTSADGLVGVRPYFYYNTSFQPQFGLHLFHDRLLGPRTAFDTTVTGGPNNFYADVRGRPTPEGDRIEFVFGATFDRREDFLYTGLGTTAPLPAGALPPARYTGSELDLRALLTFHATRWLSAGLGGWFGFQRFSDGSPTGGDRPISEIYCVRLADGRCAPSGQVDDALVPGFSQGTQFLRASALVRFDTRDGGSIYHTAPGVIVDLRGDYSHGLGDDPSSYFRVGGGAGVFINLWQDSRFLILRADALAVAPVDNTIIPFTQLATLGGPEDLRGFLLDSFRGQSSFIATAEYRWPIWMWIDGTVFVDYGGVFGRWWSGFGAGRMQPDVGVGVRITSGDRFFLRLQLAYGFGDGFQFLIAGSNRL
jgi:hypothetical protein